MSDPNANDETILNEEEVEGEEEEVEGEEEEDEEPKLKYHRLGGYVSELLKNEQEAASCMAIHEKFLILGTHSGIVSILDVNGNENRTFKCHETSVNQLSIDDCGEFVASCCNGGKVCINSLYGTDPPIEYEFHRPIMSVALDPHYAKKQSKPFVIGGKSGNLILNSKGWFGRKDVIIHSGEGCIFSVKWNGSLIAWANELGVKIYDCDRQKRISFIPRPDESPRAELYKCNLSWENEHSLLVGWADSVTIAQIKERRDSNGILERFAEIVAKFQTEYFISGIAPFGDFLAILAYSEESIPESEKLVGKPPELRIVSRLNEELSSDALTIHDFEKYQSNHYSLGYMITEPIFYVVSPKDIVVAKPRDLDDHITWLIEKKKYAEALKEAEEHQDQLQQHKLVDIGQQHIEYLVGKGEIEEAAGLCPKILKNDEKLWEKWIYKFGELNHYRAICDFIPTNNPKLSQTVYEMILGYFLQSDQKEDHVKFYNIIQQWPSDLYNIKTIIKTLNTKLQSNEEDILMDALAQLYIVDRRFNETLAIYLRRQKGPVFELIQTHNLFSSVKTQVVQLIRFNEEKAIQLLINNIDKIPVEDVVAQLKKDKQMLFLHKYLHNLFVKDPQAGQKFHEDQVSLYAEYDIKLLLPFLKQSNHYPLEKAYKICEEKKLFLEMVFILGRMGNNRQGLQLLIEKIGDVKMAIEFIQTVDDKDLWEDLISYSMKNADFVSSLLEHIGAYVDPRLLIRRIPEGMRINGLRDKLVKIISDYNLQMSLIEGCKEILKSDCVDLATRLYKAQRRGLKIEESTKCAICSRNIISSKTQEGGIQIFFCHHVYHLSCLRSSGTDSQTPSNSAEKSANLPNGNWCTICQNQASESSNNKKKLRTTNSNTNMNNNLPKRPIKS